ncbi:MAG: benzoyl-CoA reductase, bzd-type, subunit Q [Deltaproteobacteria bacterium CG1_02_45_11]|nr:MAG: benzoyl-CoA reductase, bzd-type, subunit Q [Deltaproteobacteria bacterium CG1_02_45_11]
MNQEQAKKEYWRWDETNWSNKDIDWKAAKIITGGVDVGSVSSQAVIMADGELYAYANTRTGYNSPESATNVMNWALEATSGMKLDDIQFTVGTGYGRVKVPFANKAITEIACHARGANFMYGPTVRTVMDMGGQDLKAIRCDERGKVLNFLMNEKCAAGTGRGMEVIADLLEVPIQEVGQRSLDVEEDPPPVSNTCVLFAKSEMMGLLKRGYSLNKALAAYCSAMAYRVYTQIREVDVEKDFVITGGIAKNSGIVQRLEKLLGIASLKTEVDYQLAGAIGAALFGKVLYEKSKK